MKPFVLVFRSLIEHSSEKVLQWHLNPQNFERKTPPWLRIKPLSSAEGQIIFKMKMGIFWKKWILERQEELEGKSYTDMQIEGPFKYWKQIRRVHPIDQHSCEWEEEIHFLAPYPFMKGRIKKALKRSFDWKIETLIHDLQVYKLYSVPPLNILVSGSSGLVGRGIIPFLRGAGHRVTRLVRNGEKEEDTLIWDPKTGNLENQDFNAFDAVIHLAGKNIGSSRWTPKHKEEIFTSRCRDTWVLTQLLTRLQKIPKTFICASAVGIYGNRGNEQIHEEICSGKGFLADVCQNWENASNNIENKGARVVHARFGVVLSSRGGMLARLLPIFRIGLGVIMGSGKQYMSWISLDDLLYGLYHVLNKEELKGAFNFTTPNPETAEEFSQKLAQALHRPLFFRIGERPLHFFLGEMADEMLLSSIQAIPTKLLGSGFQFHYPTIENAFEREIF